MRNFFYKKLFYYHYQLPDKPTKFFLKKVFKARTLLEKLLTVTDSGIRSQMKNSGNVRSLVLQQITENTPSILENTREASPS